MRDARDLAPHEALTEPLMTDALVYSVYTYARMNGLSRERFYEVLVDALIANRRELHRALIRELEAAPPRMVVPR